MARGRQHPWHQAPSPPLICRKTGSPMPRCGAGFKLLEFLRQASRAHRLAYFRVELGKTWGWLWAACVRFCSWFQQCVLLLKEAVICMVDGLNRHATLPTHPPIQPANQPTHPPARPSSHPPNLSGIFTMIPTCFCHPWLP